MDLTDSFGTPFLINKHQFIDCSDYGGIDIPVD